MRKIIKIIATRCHILRLNEPNSISGVCTFVSASEMTDIVSGGALNSTLSLSLSLNCTFVCSSARF